MAISERKTIPLAEELALCEHFLAIEKIRFGEKLNTQFDIELASLDVQVPPMFLQPLIENAIKHGIYPLTQGGVVQLKSTIRDAHLHIAISNPIDQVSLESAANRTRGTGTGLKNLKARFENFYGGNASVSWQLANSVFNVNINIPLESARQLE